MSKTGIVFEIKYIDFIANLRC